MEADYFAHNKVIFKPHVVELQSTEDFITDCLASESFISIFPNVKTREDVEALIEPPTGARPNGWIICEEGETPERRKERSDNMKAQEIMLNGIRKDLFAE